MSAPLFGSLLAITISGVAAIGAARFSADMRDNSLAQLGAARFSSAAFGLRAYISDNAACLYASMLPFVNNSSAVLYIPVVDLVSQTLPDGTTTPSYLPAGTATADGQIIPRDGWGHPLWFYVQMTVMSPSAAQVSYAQAAGTPLIAAQLTGFVVAVADPNKPNTTPGLPLTSKQAELQAEALQPAGTGGTLSLDQTGLASVQGYGGAWSQAPGFLASVANASTYPSSPISWLQGGFTVANVTYGNNAGLVTTTMTCNKQNFNV